MTESDITITEGSTRQIQVQRQNLDSPTNLTVFVTTVDGYRQNTRTNCSTALSVLLGVDESQVDPAEGECTPHVLIIKNALILLLYIELLYVTSSCDSMI